MEIARLKLNLISPVRKAVFISSNMTPKQKEQWQLSVTCFLEQALTNVKEIERKAIAKQHGKL